MMKSALHRSGIVTIDARRTTGRRRASLPPSRIGIVARSGEIETEAPAQVEVWRSGGV